MRTRQLGFRLACSGARLAASFRLRPSTSAHWHILFANDVKPLGVDGGST
jgi:hypothetical protein